MREEPFHDSAGSGDQGNADQMPWMPENYTNKH